MVFYNAFKYLILAAVVIVFLQFQTCTPETKTVSNCENTNSHLFERHEAAIKELKKCQENCS